MSEEQSKPRFTNVQVIIVSFVVSLVLVVGGGILLLPNLNPQDQEPTPTAIGDGVTIISPPKPLQDFTMDSSNGDPLSLSDLQGNLVLMAFGYTHCPDVCPVTLLNFKRVKEALGSSAENLRFVFVSVDPQRDTPEVLAQYLKRYDEDFIGLSGNDDELERIGPDYDLYYAIRENPDSAAGYIVEHTATRFLIDAQGRLIRIYSFTTDVDTIVEDLRGLLNPQS